VNLIRIHVEVDAADDLRAVFEGNVEVSDLEQSQGL
jgi:hypothetical protein